MLPVVFEPTIPASEKPQTHALNREAPGIGVGNIDPRKVPFERLMTALESVQSSVGTFNTETPGSIQEVQEWSFRNVA